MPNNPDFKDLFKILNEEKVKYLIVGAYAVTFYSEPRYTKDLDIWVEPSAENAEKIWTALTKFGAPLLDISLKDFSDEKLVYQIGVEPNRINIMMGITGLKFETAWEDRVRSEYSGVPVNIINLGNLIATKKAAGRPQDLIDVKNLENIKKRI